MAASSTGRTGNRTDAPKGERRALSPALSQFLVQLSIAIQKTAAYPPGHPALEPAIHALTQRLDRLLATRRSAEFGVAADRLLIEGGATDPSNAVLRSLAGALRRHGIGSIRFDRGVTTAEMAGLLEELNRKPPDRTTMATGTEERFGQGPHIAVRAASDEPTWQPGDGDPAASEEEDPWTLLCRAIRPADGDAGSARAADLAAALRRKRRDEQYARNVVGTLVVVLDDLAGQEPHVEPAKLERVQELIDAAGEETLLILLERASDGPLRQQLVTRLSGLMPFETTVTFLRAAAAASGRQLSGPLLDLLRKWSAGMADSLAARDAFREIAGRAVLGTMSGGPVPNEHHSLIREISASHRKRAGSRAPEPWMDAIRLVDIALEANAVGPAVWTAVNELIRLGRLDDLLEALEDVRDSQAARQIRAHLGRPEQIRTLLQTRQSRRGVRQLIRWTDLDAADVLLDGLESVDARATRRLLIERLARMGPAIADRLLARLESGSWFVKRNMLYVLSEMAELPEGLDPKPWLDDPDPRIRREAVRLGLRIADSRASAIAVGIGLDDTRLLNQVIAAAMEDCPPGLAPALIAILEDPAADEGVRLNAVRLLGRTGERIARDWLMKRVLEKGKWWRRPRLAQKSRELLVALSALRRWRHHRDVALTLELARTSSDVEIQFAASSSNIDWS